MGSRSARPSRSTFPSPTSLPSAGVSISAVNLSEVIAKMADLGMDADLNEAVMGPLQLPAITFDAAQARIAGLMPPATRPLGLSLGDRACLALAEQSGAAAMTTD